MLIDAFPFFNEIGMLKTRLAYLGEHVDQFIAIESSIDFSGRPKSILLTPEVISTLPYADKFKVHVWEPDWFSRFLIFPLARDLRWRKILWQIQNRQRNALLQALSHAHDSDWILFGDLDEFIDRNELYQLHQLPDSDRIYSVQQQMYYYNLLVKHREIWSGTALCRLRAMRRVSPNFIRHKRLDHEKVFHGWHFSYFADLKSIQQKIKIISGAENLSAFENISVDAIKKQIEQGADLYGRTGVDLLRLKQPDVPEEIVELMQNYL